jgi:integrase
VTVGAVIDAYHDLTRLERSTRVKHTSVLKHLTPAVRKMRADQLTRRDVSLLYKRLSDAGVGDSTIRSLHGILGAAFQQAFVDEWIPRNPFRGAVVPPEPSSKAATISHKDRALLTAAAAQDGAETSLWLRIHLVTGARCAEVLALRSSSLKGDKLTIDGAIERGIDRKRKTTKTRKPRTLTIDAVTVDQIRCHLQTQRATALAAPGVTLARDPYLFAEDPTGARPWRADRGSQLFGKLRELVARADADVLRIADPSLTKRQALAEARANRPTLHSARLHDCRHTVASELLADGLDIPTVAERLGDDARTILRVYGHMVEGRDREAAEASARRLG